MPLRIDSIEFTDKGVVQPGGGILYKHVQIAIASGSMQYPGADVGSSEDIVDVYRERSAAESAVAALRDTAGMPVIVEHGDPSLSNRDAHDGYVVPNSVSVLGDYIYADVMVTSKDGIRAIENGIKGLSMGYNAEIIKREDGKYYQEKLDFTAPGSHLALVQSPRCDRHNTGACRITDCNDKGDKHMPDLRKVVVDGLSVETTDQGAEAITKLQGQVARSDAALEAAKASYDAALAEKDTELAAKDSELQELKKKVLTPEQLDAAVVKRAELVTKAVSVGLHVDSLTGKSDGEIRRAAVSVKHPDISLDGKSDTYVEAMFDLLKTGDPLAPGAAQGSAATTAAVDGNQQPDAYTQMRDHLSSAWKGGDK